MKKLSEMSSGDEGTVLYLPYDYDSLIVKRFERVKVILNIFGHMMIKTENGIRFINKKDAESITCE